MIGQVTEWKMTEEERLAYIAKHPIRPTPDMDLKRRSAYIHISKNKKRKVEKA